MLPTYGHIRCGAGEEDDGAVDEYAFIEYATGIAEGGRTGITAIVTGIMFFVSIFFAPIFASIPSWATGGALVIVGSLMIRT